mgnify:CR=1 FL=1|tara:strand:+ start:388 stop:567 length:180 start_codon:yes stop_codon:yes gene_type:complete
MPKFNWKQKKTIAMYLNKRQALEVGQPINTSGIEILIENGNFLVRETSTANNIKYIITE